MSEHTKGPWEARWSERGQYWFIDHPQQEGSATLTKLDCDEADARLIAAAPDMLEMLRDVVAVLNDPDADWTDAHRVEREILAVIAKATGQEV
jgi:hypothetical protein